MALGAGDAAAARSFMSPTSSITTAGWLDAPAEGETWLGRRGTEIASGAPWAMVLRYTDVYVGNGRTWRIEVRPASGRP